MSQSNPSDEYRDLIEADAAWARASIAKRAAKWKSGGIPGGRRETRALAAESCRYWTPREWAMAPRDESGRVL